jgi:hypothetical protein
MKLLHILKSEPDDLTTNLIDLLSEGNETTTFVLYEGEPDYEQLIDLIFASDNVVTWW